MLGQPLMEHQQLIADVGGEVLPNGLPAFREVIVTLMRQQGKTTLVLSTEVERCTLRGSAQRVAYTAQSGSDARKKLIDDQVPILQASKLWPAVRRVQRGMDATGVIWKNGSRIDVLSSTVSAGHGKIVDLGMIDEAFDDLDDRREQAMLPAMITRTDAQLYVVSTMGTDASVYLNRKVDAGRAAALEGRTSGIAYFEWAVPDDEDIDDPRVWWRHMPALGRTIPEASVAHARQTMTDGDFRRAFGNQRTRSLERVIPEAAWRAANTTDLAPGTGLVFAVEVAQDRDWSAIVSAGYADGVPVIEMVDYRPGTGWLDQRCAELVAKHGGKVWVEEASPASSAVTDRKLLKKADAVAASGEFYDAVADLKVRIRTDTRFETAHAAATKQPVAESWRFGRRAGRDVCPIVAATLALWALRHGIAEFYVY